MVLIASKGTAQRAASRQRYCAVIGILSVAISLFFFVLSFDRYDVGPAVSSAVDARPNQEALRNVVPVAGSASSSSYRRATSPTEHDFLSLALKTGTDKVGGQPNWDVGKFKFVNATNPRCRVWGHFYHTSYQKWLGPMSGDDAEPFQMLEVGFSNGNGFEAFLEFLPRAELHSMELRCDLFDRKSARPWYASVAGSNRFHCGDASDYDFLNRVWTEHMKRPDAPPLRVVVDDASHLSRHQIASVFFWFPRLAPGGLMIVEDVQPNGLSNTFRSEFLPQMIVDMHFCGDSDTLRDVPCFPTLQPLLKSVSCEMHICVFERNELPAVDIEKELSIPPKNALNFDLCREMKKAAASAS